MKILLVGSGGREHALAWKLSQEAEIICAPGNPGISQCARIFPVPIGDQSGLVELACREAVDLVVIGPEDALIAGLADALRSRGVSVFGPGAAGAKLEGSKAFSKQLMHDAGVPTADFAIFIDSEAAHRYIDATGSSVVVKASGAALGKGVIVCDSAAEAHDAIESMMVDETFGKAGQTVVIEERLSGPEFSLMTLCSNGEIFSLPVAQDYKRALDGNRGPNTGGMGSVSPVEWLSANLVEQTEATVVAPTLAALRNQGIEFRGVLFSGLMVHEGQVQCLEFNVRFGDPETESQMMRLGSGFAAALKACADGRPIPAIEVLNNAAVTVIVASGGYPNAYEKGIPISVGTVPEGVRVFQAGTSMDGGALVTSGGRVLAVSASGESVDAARELAYKGVEEVSFHGAYCRRDIARN
jgi:phosphoribosylamine---glycine ligase